MKRFKLLFWILGLMAVVSPVLGRDTGTYEILDYRVMLTPHSDGMVTMEYYQKWEVTGGHIPWITVGTANDDYKLSTYGGAVTDISSASEGGWSGVRLDLDKDYQSGETFEVSFILIQSRLFFADEKNYGLNFTPGWYDRAPIRSLQIAVKFFASLETIKAEPRPNSITGDEMIWVKSNLDPGERFSISVSFPKNLFPAEIGKTNLRRGATPASQVVVFMLIGGLVIFFIILRAIVAAKRLGYSGGHIFYGGFPGGIGRTGGKGSGGGRSTGGGGGFGGASTSCACACVSCACACACAGGGGAGWRRKLAPSCPLSHPLRRV
jgi:hypothetical protein